MRFSNEYLSIGWHGNDLVMVPKLPTSCRTLVNGDMWRAASSRKTSTELDYANSHAKRHK